MIHPEHQRRAYLQAMGIDVWLPRDGDEPGLVEQPAVSVEGLGWDDLRECVANCTRCELSQSRTNTVFGVGNPEADWLIIGEAPGAEEDRRGEPFVGRAGQLLDQMLLAIGQSRDSVFIANILKCRPPNNRDPKPDEAAACRAYLERQIELLGPKIILAVGKIAAQNLLGVADPVGRMRGRPHRFGGIPLVVTYHPAYLLRPSVIRDMSHDDVFMVSDIERRSYEFPWSHGVFRDCLLAGYQNIVLVRDSSVVGYGVLSIAAGEAHILNICVHPDYRSHGYGEKLLDELLFRARAASVRTIFLEVRPSNERAIAKGREDAAVLAKKLVIES
jgi:DNA polymerase